MNLRRNLKSTKIVSYKLYEVWKIFGIDNNQKLQRAKTVWLHVQNLLKDILEEETEFCNDIKGRIESYQVKIQELSKALSVTTKEIDEISLIKKKEILRQELDNLSKLKHKRLKEYRDLRSIELQYCRILNIKEHQLSSNTEVPSENDLSELEQHIAMLKDEKERRHKKFCMAKKELTTIWETTEFTPETSLEKEILLEKEISSLSNETFKALEELMNKVKRKKAELEAEKNVLMKKLTTLWERLKVDESKRVEFLSKHVDHRLSTIKSIHHEIEKCEKIKRENIKMFIASLRQELLQLWNKCYISDSIQQGFLYYSTTEMTDEVLEAHEEEVEKWKKYYEEVHWVTSLKPLGKRPQLTTPKSAPSKLLKSSTGVSLFRTPAAHQSKVRPSTVAKSMSKVTKLFSSRPNPIQQKDRYILRERNQSTAPNPKASPNGTTYTDFAKELNRTSRANLRSSVLATRKRGGTRTSINNSRNKRKSFRKSTRNISGTVPNLTPARGKVGLPFLI
ncbi:protein regulator of cytokinesis 1 [Caerostris extrusa]|uniref:Protein regulator of cytokinesis 1 n=1 Tax=Caerostris extrusa TaxID=172846 RepID=A0AAV4MTK2_CAEEX|nr:protein regulator of cytokinesis 1 [Caerostris extrusa]